MCKHSQNNNNINILTLYYLKLMFADQQFNIYFWF